MIAGVLLGFGAGAGVSPGLFTAGLRLGGEESAVESPPLAASIRDLG